MKHKSGDYNKSTKNQNGKLSMNSTIEVIHPSHRSNK